MSEQFWVQLFTFLGVLVTGLFAYLANKRSKDNSEKISAVHYLANKRSNDNSEKISAVHIDLNGHLEKWRVDMKEAAILMVRSAVAEEKLESRRLVSEARIEAKAEGKEEGKAEGAKIPEQFRLPGAAPKEIEIQEQPEHDSDVRR